MNADDVPHPALVLLRCRRRILGQRPPRASFEWHDNHDRMTIATFVLRDG
jgi:hypothetical protein